METSTAEVLYTPDNDERVGTSIAVGPFEFGPKLTFGSYNSQHGKLVTLTLNTEGKVIEGVRIKNVPFTPRFLAYTESQSLVVAGSESLYLVDPTEKKKLIKLLQFPFYHGCMVSGGYVLDRDRVIVGSIINSFLSDSRSFGPTYIVDLQNLRVADFPLSCKNYGGSFCHNGKFFNVDVPTQEIRVFNLADWTQPYTTLINFKEHWTGNSFPTGITGPYSFEGNHYCLVTLSDRSGSLGRVVVVCIETGKVVYEVLLLGAGQTTSAVVSNGYVYMTTSARDYNEYQLKRNPKAGSVYSCKAPKFLSNPPQVPLLSIE
jgi:hypothetical protein